MTSMDSGVDMGNDSNDSFITQQEFSTAGMATTTTTTITTTLTAALNCENGTNTFLVHTKPLSLQSPISSVPAIQKDTDTGSSEILMPISSVSPSILNPSEYRRYTSSRNSTRNFRLEDNFRLYQRGLEELRLPCTHSVDRLRCTDVVKYKPNCYGKMKSFRSSRNRRIDVAWSYAFNRDPAIHKKILLTKMRFATATNNTELMKRLLTNGMSPDFHDEKGQTALHIASSQGYTDMVQLLLLHGANPNQRDCVGNTPLHLASLCCRISIITLLLKAGAEIVSRDKDGFNPLQLAQQHLRLCQERFKGSNVDDMLKVKQEIHEIVNLLLTYLQKQKNSQEAVEALSKVYSSLSLSNTADQIQYDVKGLLANLNGLNIAS
ncbi:uncharacterized protein LOC143354829 [Halictus rubicundus]|uniref:uncharacterized protein LOC143354829 n=1 Tax=Halictus rubicundus TaxID=77578 RepID=UPI0040357967